MQRSLRPGLELRLPSAEPAAVAVRAVPMEMGPATAKAMLEATALPP